LFLYREDGNAITTFEPSPLMSTYLLAFVVSDLESISNNATKQIDETLHRIWVRSDSLKKAQYALVNSEAVLKALEEYVDFDFKLPKIDSVGVPRKSGAMENWGMVTYRYNAENFSKKLISLKTFYFRESAMIYEENYDDIPHAAKLSGVNVISHELAHQFFGDSVTCEWWDYIWLNEGFATLFEYHLMGIVYPKWRTRDFFNVRRVQNAMRSDSDENTRAMTSTLLTTAEILNAFNYVVYDKGKNCQSISQ
jgi:aminopeptidase N